jgi:hypothetical protein
VKPQGVIGVDGLPFIPGPVKLIPLPRMWAAMEETGVGSDPLVDLLVLS